MAHKDNTRFRGPDIVLKKRQAVGHGECQNPDCGHLVTWYDMLPDEDYSNCVVCSGFLIVTAVRRSGQIDSDEQV